MNLARKAFATVATVAFALAIAFLSLVPTSYAGTDDAMLRLSWRLPGLMVEECRTRTQEELDALAPHMRTPQVCTGLGADFELTIDLEGGPSTRDTIRPAGARRDRPVYVFREIPVEPGTHSIAVSFRALVPEGFEAEGRALEYGWQGDAQVGPAEIALVTLDETSGSLVLRGR